MAKKLINFKISEEDFQKHQDDLMCFGTAMLLVKPDGTINYVDFRDVPINDKAEDNKS